MTTFHFYSLSDEEAARLRADIPRCRTLLAACVPLATKLATIAGISTPLTEADKVALQGFHDLVQAFAGYEYESDLALLCSQAGLLPSDSGLLAGRVETLYWEREPVLAEAEVTSIVYQWLHDHDA